MKSLNRFLSEKLVIGKNIKLAPEHDELIDILADYIENDFEIEDKSGHFAPTQWWDSLKIFGEKTNEAIKTYLNKNHIQTTDKIKFSNKYGVFIMREFQSIERILMWDEKHILQFVKYPDDGTFHVQIGYDENKTGINDIIWGAQSKYTIYANYFIDIRPDILFLIDKIKEKDD